MVYLTADGWRLVAGGSAENNLGLAFHLPQIATCDLRPGSLTDCRRLAAGGLTEHSEPYPLSRTVFKVIAPVFRQIDNSRTIIMDSLSCHP